MSRPELSELLLAALPEEARIAKLQEMEETLSTLERTRSFLGEKPWSHIAHAFGYIAPGTGTIPIVSAGAIDADPSLIRQRIVVRIDRLYVEEYPGFGEHCVLLTFKAQNQTELAAEPASFNRTYRARDRQSVATNGQPIFVGLNVGPQGVGLECSTVNVKSAGDEAILAGLGSTSFSGGLELLTAAQPVLKPFSEMTLGLAKILASRSKNAAVQSFYLGLDFDVRGGGARLREGSYVAMQAPDSDVNWQDWAYDANQQSIVGARDASLRPYYNHIIFRVSRFEA